MDRVAFEIVADVVNSVDRVAFEIVADVANSVDRVAFEIVADVANSEDRVAFEIVADVAVSDEICIFVFIKGSYVIELILKPVKFEFVTQFLPSELVIRHPATPPELPPATKSEPSQIIEFT